MQDSNLAVVNALDHEKLIQLIEMSNFAKKNPSKTSKRVKCLTKGTGNS